MRSNMVRKRAVIVVAASLMVLTGAFHTGCIKLTGAKVPVPVTISGATQVGSVHFELVYDPEDLELTGVQQGSVLGAAQFHYNMDNPGQVVVGIVSTAGINGNGQLAVLTFRLKRTGKSAASLNLENVVLHSASTLLEIPAVPTKGSITSKESFTSPTLLIENQ
jgi:hypothetical protein